MRFSFLYILANICYLCFFDDSHSERCEVVSHCALSWFAFFWWLAMLSIFSCACLPSMYLWENVYSNLLTIFKLDYYYLLLSCVSCLYACIFTKLSFHFVYGVFYCASFLYYIFTFTSGFFFSYRFFLLEPICFFST